MITSNYKGIEIITDNDEVYIPSTDSCFEGEQAYLLACKEIDTLQASLKIEAYSKGDLIQIVSYEGVNSEIVYDDDLEQTVNIISISKENTKQLVEMLLYLVEEDEISMLDENSW